jgi:Na+/melibiose symporter-like transporter
MKWRNTMAQQKSKREAFAQKVFGAESDSAAKLEKDKLDRYKDIAAKMFNTPVLRPKEMAFPAIAEFASQILVGVTYYRTLYFVNVLKIDMIYVTAILTLIGIWDVLNDPLMGIAYDKTRTRWGKARPYMLFAPIPYFFSTAVLYSGALFLNSDATDDPKKIIFVFLALFIQETFSTIYTLPKNNMATLMTPNPTLGLVTQYVGSYGAQLVYLIFMPLQDLNRWGVTNVSMAAIFSILGCACACLGAAGNIAMAIGCRERILLQPKPAPVTKTMFYILKNKYALRNFITDFTTSWWSSGGYSWDIVSQLEIFGGAFKSALFYTPHNIIDPLSVALVPRFQMFKHNNKNAFIFLRFLDFSCGLMSFLIGQIFIDKSWIVGGIFGLFYAINALNNGPAKVFEAEIGREINDYTEYMTGERPDGTINLLTNLIKKVTSPLNALMTIAVFKWSGYDPTIAMSPWSQGSRIIYKKVLFLYMVFGGLPEFIKIIPYFFYDIQGKKREDMYIALNERRAYIAKEKADEMSEEMSAMVEMMENNGNKV